VYRAPVADGYCLFAADDVPEALSADWREVKST
jgi:hypothetical protein